MESIVYWLSQHADNAPFLIFGLLVITGLSVPISEDLLLIASGVLASEVIPEHAVALFLAVFLGCYFSDCVAYALGRYMGANACNITWIKKRFTSSQFHMVQKFFDKYGVITLVVGRCIPFGFRNAIFMSAGAGKMNFGKFAISDALACFFFSLCIFYLAYVGSQQYEQVYEWVHRASLGVGITVLSVLVPFGIWAVIKFRKAKSAMLGASKVSS